MSAAVAARAIVCAAIATAIFITVIGNLFEPAAPRCGLPRVDPDYRCATFSFQSDRKGN